MKTAQDFINKLSRLTWVSIDGDSITSEEGFTLSWSHKLHSFGFQLIARVTKGDVYIMTWGFESSADEKAFGQWLHPIKNDVRTKYYEAKKEAENTAENEFNAI